MSDALMNEDERGKTTNPKFDIMSRHDWVQNLLNRPEQRATFDTFPRRVTIEVYKQPKR